MKIIYRYDKGEIRSANFTPEGFLSVDAVITRTGVFLYRNPDGSLRRELRHPDDILKADSLKTAEMLPITLLHPQEKSVDSLNSSRLSKGFTGQDVRVDGKYIINKLLVTDQEAIDAVLNGTQELSCGYKVTLVDEAGEYDNEAYDYRQKDVVYNHVAIVPVGRAGPEARIKLDEGDAYQCVNVTTVENKDVGCGGTCGGECSCKQSDEYIGKYTIDNKEFAKKRTDNKPTNQPKEKPMHKINIDGIEYEAAPEVINALKKANDRADKAEASLKTATDEKTQIQAKLDTSEADLKKVKESNNDEAIQTSVKSRLDLIAKAKDHLDEETMKKVFDMSDNEIKLAVIKSHYPDFNKDEKDEDYQVYITARYDSAIEMKKETPNNDAMAQQRRATSGQSKGSHNDKNTVDQEKARLDMIEQQRNAWKTPAATGTDGK